MYVFYVKDMRRERVCVSSKRHTAVIRAKNVHRLPKPNVRFGSQADICAATSHVCFTPPIATAKANFRTRSCPLYPRKRTCAMQLGMSALGLIADIRRTYSITSSANKRKDSGIVRPRFLAVFKLTTRLNLVGSCTGSSAGFAPRNTRST